MDGGLGGWGGVLCGRGHVGSLTEEGVGHGDWIIILLNILKRFTKTQTFNPKSVTMYEVDFHSLISWNFKKMRLGLTPDKEIPDHWYSVAWGKGVGQGRGLESSGLGKSLSQGDKIRNESAECAVRGGGGE